MADGFIAWLTTQLPSPPALQQVSRLSLTCLSVSANRPLTGRLFPFTGRLLCPLRGYLRLLGGSWVHESVRSWDSVIAAQGTADTDPAQIWDGEESAVWITDGNFSCFCPSWSLTYSKEQKILNSSFLRGNPVELAPRIWEPEFIWSLEFNVPNSEGPWVRLGKYSGDL